MVWTPLAKCFEFVVIVFTGNYSSTTVIVSYSYITCCLVMSISLLELQRQIAAPCSTWGRFL